MRDEVRSARLTAEEAALIDEAARLTGCSVSEFVRRAALLRARLTRPAPCWFWTVPSTTVAGKADVIWQDAG